MAASDPMSLLLPQEITGDQWPVPVKGKLIEPGCGVVRIRRPAETTLELDVEGVRQLAQCAGGGLATVLWEAAWEAERQGEILGEAMGE